ncbi:MAG: PQQ-binding-like beta-propeller repeat protein [Bryobacteraceae bacterium]
MAVRAGRAFCALAVLTVPAVAQEWRSYGGDPGGTKYSPLRQIDRANVTRLKPAWIYHTGDISDGTKWPTRSAFEATPLAVDGVLYVTTPFSRLVALDAATGRELWSFDPKIDRRQSTNLFINRGAAWWSHGGKRRVLLGTIDGRLFSIVAGTGRPDDSFGTAGWVDLRKGVADHFPGRSYGMTSPPAIYKDLVICGSLVPDGEPRGPSGDVRAFDVRTGKLAWTFHTVAQAGEYGNDTWPADGWQDRGGLNAWPPISVDVKHGIVFLPLTSPSTDFFGGDRAGAGLFGDSLVALDAATGRRLWHFQTIHHNLWDYDLPAQPVLVQVRRNGELIDAVAQVTKTGFTFLFERTTGKPLFPIEEVPVAASEVPGEHAWPTQPRPLKPPPYLRQKMSADELTDVTPESRAYCAKLIDGAVLGEIFRPIGLQPTVLFPGTNGGANWGGASFDPETQTLYVNSMDVGMLYRMVKRPEGSVIPYRPQGSGTPNSRFWTPDLLPCQKPPWGFLTAIDLNAGDFRWRSVLGVVDALEGKGLPPTGSPNIGGSLVTAGGLVFIGATNDSRFRAFDKDTGKELWVTHLPASAHATPMTFLDRRSGRQFVVIAAGGGNKYNRTYSDSLMAFALPSGNNDSGPSVEYHHETGGTPAKASLGRPQTTTASPPAPFDHRLHAPLNLTCTTCHATAESGVHAGLPAVSACLTCHKTRAAPPTQAANQLPDFVFFSHARHHSANVSCDSCHSDIWKPMKMADCIICHRTNNAGTACTLCHELSQ